jgi:hypothetical protein
MLEEIIKLILEQDLERHSKQDAAYTSNLCFWWPPEWLVEDNYV